MARPLYGVTTGGDLSTPRKHRPGWAFGFRINRDDHRLAAVALRQSRDQRGIRQRRRVHAHLVGTGLDHRRRVIVRPNPATHRQGNEQLFGDRTHGFGEGPASFERGGDVEDDDLVDAVDVISPRQFRRITGVRN